MSTNRDGVPPPISSSGAPPESSRPVPNFPAPETRAGLVVEGLRGLILSGALPPGARLRQNEIAEWFSVSTTPVREALASLTEEGFLRQSAYRGVEVYRPTRGDVSEAFEIRLALEPLATELAASHIPDDALARLDQLMEQMEHRDQTDFGSELNGQFHFVIYQAAESPKLLEFIGRLRYGGSAYVRLLNSVSTSNDEYRAATDTEHRAIAAALRAHDGPAARVAMAEHIEHARMELKDILPEK